MSGIARLLHLAPSMQVHVLFFGQLKDATGFAAHDFDASETASLGSIWDDFAARFPRLGAHRPHVRAARNHEFASFETRVEPGDEVAFLPPVSGGCGTLVSLTRDPIDARALVCLVQRPTDGAVATFEGVVRDNTKGRPTEFLEYECYEAMALRLMEELRCELRAKHAIGEVAIVHRLGRLAIGEASVVIVVAAPHRKAAFDACSEAINRLKSSVPIWKKEHFAGGEIWVEGDWGQKVEEDAAH
jgi:molybdopterin synthase catalytic subunit/molybdopterin converting factor small subunit